MAHRLVATISNLFPVMQYETYLHLLDKLSRVNALIRLPTSQGQSWNITQRWIQAASILQLVLVGILPKFMLSRRFNAGVSIHNSMKPAYVFYNNHTITYRNLTHSHNKFLSVMPGDYGNVHKTNRSLRPERM